jgi:hypothetical protein
LVDAQGHDLTDKPLRQRRAALESFFKKYCRRQKRLRLSPGTTRLAEAAAGSSAILFRRRRRNRQNQGGLSLCLRKFPNLTRNQCVGGKINNAIVVQSLMLDVGDGRGLA